MISCDISSLLQHNPLAQLSADGITAAQLVYGKGMPAGGLFCPGDSPAGPCPVSTFSTTVMWLVRPVALHVADVHTQGNHNAWHSIILCCRLSSM